MSPSADHLPEANYSPGLNVSPARGPNGCASYHLGHVIHFIRLKLAHRNPWVSAEVLGTDGNYLTFSVPEGILVRWSHDSELVAAIAEVTSKVQGAVVQWSPSGHILRVLAADRAFMVGLAEDDSQPCSF